MRKETPMRTKTTGVDTSQHALPPEGERVRCSAGEGGKLVDRMEKTFKIDPPCAFVFYRTNAALMTKQHKAIIVQASDRDESILDVALKERPAYRAISTEGATVTELSIPVIPPKRRAPIKAKDGRVAEVNAESGFSHPTERAERKRGRKPKGQGAKAKKALPMIEGMPADYRRPDDVNGCMTVHGPERVREGFEAIKAEFGNPPSWAVLAMLIQNYRDGKTDDAVA